MLAYNHSQVASPPHPTRPRFPLLIGKGRNVCVLTSNGGPGPDSNGHAGSTNSSVTSRGEMSPIPCGTPVSTLQRVEDKRERNGMK